MPRPLGLAVVLCLALTAAGAAQERPWQRLFGPRNPAPKTPADDARRRAEIAVELAWLADPVTFPYYLEAKVEGSQLAVRGYVPDQAVRDHALRLARVHSPYSVTDALKEHPSLLVRPSRLSPPQLQSAVASSLREALPRQAAQLQAECAADGRVTVRGPVHSLEEKLLVSHSLRRLHGCSSVQNLTQVQGQERTVPATLASNPAGEKDKQPARSWLGSSRKENQGDEKKDRPTENSKSSSPDRDGRLPRVTTREDPRRSSQEPRSEKQPPPATALTQPAQLQKLIQAKCPAATAVRVEFKSASELTVELTIRSEQQIEALAGQVLSLTELSAYRVELLFKIGS